MIRARFILSTIYVILSTSISYNMLNFASVLGYRATWGRPENVKTRRSGRNPANGIPHGECRFLFIILLIIIQFFKLMISRTDRSNVISRPSN